MPTSDPFGLARPGQPVRFSAAQVAKWTDAAKRVPPGNGRGRDQRLPAGVALLKNTSGADLARFGVIGIGSPLFDPASALTAFQRELVLVGVELTAPAHLGRFAVALEPIADDAIGRVVVSGPCIVKVDKAADRDYRCAEMIASTPGKLRAVDGGSARILWHETGTGEKWAVVDIGAEPAAPIFPITMSQTGGSNGTASAAASWTYTVTHAITSASLGTTVNPTTSPHLWRRPSLGQMAAATAGLAFTNASGQLVITWCNETPGPAACT